MDGQTDGRTDRWMDGQTEFIPILQDFVPCRGRGPKRRLSQIWFSLAFLFAVGSEEVPWGDRWVMRHSRMVKG